MKRFLIDKSLMISQKFTNDYMRKFFVGVLGYQFQNLINQLYPPSFPTLTSQSREISIIINRFPVNIVNFNDELMVRFADYISDLELNL